MAIQIINTIVVSLGIPTIIGALIYIGKKLQILTSLQEAVEKIKHNMKVMGDYLTRHHSKFNPSELRSLSPLQLTDDGRRLITELKFDEIFGHNRSDFFDFIDSEHPQVKYDVEVAATKSIYVLTDKPYMQFIKVFFYNHPDRNMENTAPYTWRLR